ncbi:hypothetical protein [Paludisphaera rhizosphaerae]|uniref:hypothetical protein n=1 Tax=Paludisphaera rhizosphaerae TaxID=2711216 RepID=UPI0013EC3D76|nr:hypothetical protein [Paludisphaera rhizosphaerae]
MIYVALAVTIGLSPSAEERNFLEAVRDVYRSNLSGVTVADVSFRFSTGNALTLIDALAGKWTKRSNANGRLVFNESLKRFDRVSSLDDSNASRKWITDKSFKSDLPPSVRVVTDGNCTFLDKIEPSVDGSKFIHGVQIHAGIQPFNTYARIPLGLGGVGDRVMNLAADLDSALLENADTHFESIDRDAVLDGKPLIRITFNHNGGQREYWIDLQRGATPQQIVTRSTKHQAFTIIYDDFYNINNTTWYPFRELVFTEGGLARETIIERHSKFTGRLPENAFELDFPEPIAVMDQARMLKYAPRVAWKLDSLPSASSRDAAPVFFQEPQVEVPKMPSEREAASHLGWTVAGGFALVIFGCITLTRKFKRNRKSS